MALGPEYLKQKVEASLKEVEEAIDNAIRNARPGDTTVYVTPPKNFSPALMPQVRDLYCKLGWQRVDYFGDQRDGDSIIVSMHPWSDV